MSNRPGINLKLRAAIQIGVVFMLVVVSSFQILPEMVQRYRANILLLELLGDFNSFARQSVACDAAPPFDLARLTAEQRLIVGNIFLSVDCLDAALYVLPELTIQSGRSDLFVYSLGQVAWVLGDFEQFAAIWQHSTVETQGLLKKAFQTLPEDVDSAMKWYEVALITAESDAVWVEALRTYTLETQGFVAPDVFYGRLLVLANYFGPETAFGHRLMGQYLMGGDSQVEALPEFEQAVQLGLDDSETWYWIGHLYHWILHDPAAAEDAYLHALNAPIQISMRRHWYLYRLALLLNDQDRVDEAIRLQEEVVQLRKLYRYQDFLAVLYAKAGNLELAAQACAAAQKLPPSDEAALYCERP